MKTTKQTLGLVIPELETGIIDLDVVGVSPLVMNKFPAKARQQMLDKHMGKATGPKELKDPWANFVGSLHWLSKQPKKVTAAVLARSRFGFPSRGFKASVLDAALQAQLKKTDVRRAFWVYGEMSVDGDQLVPIVGRPVMREDVVRNFGMKPDVRHRGEFWPWAARLRIEYVKDAITPEQIVNLFNRAGRVCGIGENRPQKGGDWGMFKIKRQG